MSELRVGNEARTVPTPGKPPPETSQEHGKDPAVEMNEGSTSPESLVLLPQRTFQEPLDEEKNNSDPHVTIPGWDNYSAMLGVLEEYLPHMSTSTVWAMSSNPRSPLVSVCNFHSIRDPQVKFSGDLMDGQDVSLHKALASEISTDVVAQLILVEDLSPLAILTLVRSLTLPPEMFTEHLIKGGYKNFSVPSLESKLWRTAFLDKEHLSLRWFRPVRRRVDKEFLLWFEDKRTNIYREFWNIHVKEGPAQRNRVLELPGSAWEECVTIVRRQTGSCKKFIILVDPLPCVSRQGCWDEATVPFAQGVPRGPPLLDPVSVDNCLLNKGQYDRYFLDTVSTAATLADWISYHRRHRAEPSARPLAPLLALLSIIHRDTTVILSSIELVLSDILDEVDRTGSLQAVIGTRTLEVRQFHRELQGLEERLCTFVAGCLSESEMPEDFRRDFDALFRRLRDMTTRCESLQHTLRAELSSLEARRSINEAESLARLTELAFVFVPLTFAAGLFSIQVREFQDPKPAWWVFAVTAIGILFLSYVLRVVQRSRWVAGLAPLARWASDRLLSHMFDLHMEYRHRLARSMGLVFEEEREPDYLWIAEQLAGRAKVSLLTAASRAKGQIHVARFRRRKERPTDIT